jgi:hypothetical protein
MCYQNFHNISNSLKDSFFQSVSVHEDNDIRHIDKTVAAEPLVLHKIEITTDKLKRRNEQETNQPSEELTELGAETLHSHSQNLFYV